MNPVSSVNTTSTQNQQNARAVANVARAFASLSSKTQATAGDPSSGNPKHRIEQAGLELRAIVGEVTGTSLLTTTGADRYRAVNEMIGTTAHISFLSQIGTGAALNNAAAQLGGEPLNITA